MSPSTHGPSDGIGCLAVADPGTRTEATVAPVRPLRLEVAGSRSEPTTPSAPPRLTKHVRYTVTDADLSRRQVKVSLAGYQTKAPAEAGAYDVRLKSEEIGRLAARCCDLIDRMLNTEDLIERENIYRTLDVSLARLFELRTSWERPFGHLLALLLGITKHTSSESFTGGHLSALKRAIGLMKQPRIVDADLHDARRFLSRAGFDLFRPLRGVFEDV